jgi:16S rRNA (cytosine967-C5)-methyltransferase
MPDRPRHHDAPGRGRAGRGPAPRGEASEPPRRVDAARDRAFGWLAAQVERYPDLNFDDPDESGLEPRDAAFAHAIYQNVLRRWLTLAYLLNGFLAPRKLSEAQPEVVAALLGGAAQLYFLDRVPTHAAIDESVEWVKRKLNPGAAGLVNAVLRRVAELRDPASEDRPPWRDARDQIPRSDGSGVKLTSGVLPANLGQRLSVIASIPVPAIERWVRAFGSEQATRLALHAIMEPPIVINAAMARGDVTGLGVRHDVPGHVVYTGPAGGLGAALAAQGDAWVQDPSSSRTVEAIPACSPARILDLCAGQGTKTRQLAGRFPGALIIATDTDRERLRVLRGVAQGLANVRVVEIQDAESELRGAGGLADIVLLDVPCSNSGVLARRIEARYRLTREGLERMVATQREIIDRGVGLLAPGGRLVYATCSIEPEEDGEQTAWAAARFGLRVEHEELRLPQGVPGDPETGYRDGAYTSVLLMDRGG